LDIRPPDLVKLHAMRALLFFPFTFVAGLEGFGMFVPYLLAVLAVLHVARRLAERPTTLAKRRSTLFAVLRRPVLAPVRVRRREIPPL
jgi:hypothetical protein